MSAVYGVEHPHGAKCHPLKGQHVLVTDAPHPVCIGRTGTIRHDATFGHDYLSFDDGGSCDPDEVTVELALTPEDIAQRVAASPSPTGTRAYLNKLAHRRIAHGGAAETQP